MKACQIVMFLLAGGAGSLSWGREMDRYTTDEGVSIVVEDDGDFDPVDFSALKAELDAESNTDGDTKFPGLPGCEETTNLVAEYLLDRAIGATIDNFQEDVDDVRLQTSMEDSISMMRWDGFLGENETNGWTQAAKKACFDWYLNCLSTNSCARLFADDTNRIYRAIVQCRDLCYTNAWMNLRGMCRNGALPFRGDAGALSVCYSPLDDDFVSFTVEAATNAVLEPFPVWLPVLWSSFSRVSALATDNPIKTNLVSRVCLLHAETPATSRCYDSFYSIVLEGFRCSSNRLALAQMALASLDETAGEDEKSMYNVLKDYFAPITNQLLNAAQPLPEVEALRGL